jgi:arsenate reductase
VFPGVHETLHWGYEDPAAVEGTEEQRLAGFRSTLTMMSGRILSFITLARRDRAASVAG